MPKEEDDVAKPHPLDDEPTESAHPVEVRLLLLEREARVTAGALSQLTIGQAQLGQKLDGIRTDMAEREKNARERVEKLCGHISRGIDAVGKLAKDFKPGVYLIILAVVARLLAGVVETLDVDGWGSVNFVDKTDLPAPRSDNADPQHPAFGGGAGLTPMPNPD